MALRRSILAALVSLSATMTSCTSSESTAEPGSTVTVSSVAVTTTSPTTTPTTGSAATTAAIGQATDEASVPPDVPPAVFAFEDASSAEGWQVINDTVMGGVSSGELGWADGALTFSGELSLENNGGFASIRSPQIDPTAATAWASRSGVRLDADGGGRTWTVELRTDGASGGWSALLATSPTGTTSVELPWSSFTPVTRFLEPRTTTEVLDPARIETIAFFLVDGAPGPFRLAVQSIS